MTKTRGFFAQIHYQNQLAEKRKQQATNAAYRANTASIRQAEQTMARAKRAQDQAARSSAAEKKSADREAQRLYDEAMEAEEASKNAELAIVNKEIESMLQATLAVDDFVDLEQLRTVAKHPPFDRTDLEVPTPVLPPVVARDQPIYAEPPPPKGLGGLFGGKGRHDERVAQARADFARSHAEWEAETAALPAAQLRQLQEHQRAEEQRQGWLNQVRKQYQDECDAREADAARTNAALDVLIDGVRTGVEESVQEYVGIVLGNSIYPEHFPVEHDFIFDSTLKELSLDVAVPHPSSLPTEREFKYVKAKREVIPTTLPQKDQKERYSNAIGQVALRTLHEVFEADRDALILTIALTVGTRGLDPATGLVRQTPLIAVAAERSRFIGFDLSKVVPVATLQHLGALVSKSPFDLTPIDTSSGVRGK